MFLTLIDGLDSDIIFWFDCDFTSTVTFLAVSTSKFDSHGVKYVSSAITSSLILPFVDSSNKFFNFLIGTVHLPLESIVPLNKRFKLSDSTIEITGASFVADLESIFGEVNWEYVAREEAWYNSQFTPFQSVSRDEAMSVPAVMRCRNLIATTIGVMELETYSKEKGDANRMESWQMS